MLVFVLEMKRSFTEAIKKQVAASQRWTCSGCDEVLESTYQVDHTLPLWAGGADSPRNATAMCAGCHARKTQNEAIVRRQRERDEATLCRRAFEKRVVVEEEKKRVMKMRKDGAVECKDCSASYYPVFLHSCREVRRRIVARLGGSSSGAFTSSARPVSGMFEEYKFIGC
jgi:hypothetical protein